MIISGRILWVNTSMDLGTGLSLFLILKTIGYYLEKDVVSFFKWNILKYIHYEYSGKQKGLQNQINPTCLSTLERINDTNNDDW